MKNVLASTGLLVLVVLVLATGVGCANPAEVPDGRAAATGEASEYQTVTIRELVSDTTAYDGQKVLVRGEFRDMSGRPIPACEPTGTGKDPEIRESYRIYYRSWGVSDVSGTVGVRVIDKNGVGISRPLPNYEEGQQIELRGIARASTVQATCNRDVRYRSLYLEVNAADIDITLKPGTGLNPEDVQESE